MTFSFDLISDLHVESWNKKFNWDLQATSPYCIVAGDITQDRALLIDTLEQLGEVYSAVFYIDGNAEHKDYYGNLSQSYTELVALTNPIPNVVYMQDNVVIINGIAILATNGWWTYDFDTNLDLEQSVFWLQEKEKINQRDALEMSGVAYHDAAYLSNSVKKLQTQNDVKKIVLVTHTVPSPWIIEHDIELIDTWRFNSMGNQRMDMVLAEDTEKKIAMWCFGHYHMPIDTIKNNIRYVSHPRGRGNTIYSQSVYYPKRIEIKL